MEEVGIRKLLCIFRAGVIDGGGDPAVIRLEAESQ
jgi:hypothetical protein